MKSLNNKILFYVSVVFVLLTMYTNCAQYNDNNLLDGSMDEASKCEEVSCLNLNPKNDEITLNTSSTVVVSSMGTYIEVSGQCNISTYSDSLILYSVSMTNGLGGTFSYSSAEANAATRVNDKCINGKFNLRIPRILNYYSNFNAGFRCSLESPSSFLIPGGLSCVENHEGAFKCSVLFPNYQTTCLKNQTGTCAQCYQTKFLRGDIVLKLYAVDSAGRKIEHPSKIQYSIKFTDEFCNEGGCY